MQSRQFSRKRWCKWKCITYHFQSRTVHGNQSQQILTEDLSRALSSWVVSHEPWAQSNTVGEKYRPWKWNVVKIHSGSMKKFKAVDIFFSICKYCIYEYNENIPDLMSPCWATTCIKQHHQWCFGTDALASQGTGWKNSVPGIRWRTIRNDIMLLCLVLILTFFAITVKALDRFQDHFPQKSKKKLWVSHVMKFPQYQQMSSIRQFQDIMCGIIMTPERSS